MPEILKKWEQKMAPVNGSLTGFVTDEAGEPVGGASVKLGNLSTTTDDYGHFFFKNDDLAVHAAFPEKFHRKQLRFDAAV